MSSTARLATEHFFRHEHGRLVATLVAHFGTWRLQLVEDAVLEALTTAVVPSEREFLEAQLRHLENR